MQFSGFSARRAGGALALIAVTALCACSKSNSNPTVNDTPTPSPGAVVASPSSVLLSASGAGGHPKSIPSITVTQNDAAGILYLNTPPSTCPGTILNSHIATINSNYSTSGVATLTFGPIEALPTVTTRQACQFVVFPSTGTTIYITVTVDP